MNAANYTGLAMLIIFLLAVFCFVVRELGWAAGLQAIGVAVGGTAFVVIATTLLNA